MSRIASASALGIVRCHGCGLACQDVGSGESSASVRAICPRCNSSLHRRKPDSLARTTAFLLAAVILYLPANLLPVMYTSWFGRGHASTIMSGVIDFWRAGAWDISLIIFIASVAVPCAKFLVLGLLVVTVRRGSTWAMHERTHLYHFVEFIGYWSMLDVLVIALVAALVQFKALSSTEPRVGILFFGLVVILTMFAALSFDPRLIWDAKEADGPPP